jgi:hypothetical protein
MGAIRVCDRGGCPAHALHHAEIHGQDFHFCSHHWGEVPAAHRRSATPERPVTEPAAEPPERAAVTATVWRGGSSTGPR